MYISQFIHSPVGGLFSYSHLLAILDNIAMNIGV